MARLSSPIVRSARTIIAHAAGSSLSSFAILSIKGISAFLPFFHALAAIRVTPSASAPWLSLVRPFLAFHAVNSS
ncbi:MAG TPA: hypothetical protein VIO59_11290 [Rhodanobacter sp.]